MTRDSLDKFLRDLDRLHQTFRMYPRGHEQVTRAANLAATSLAQWGQPVRMSFVGEDFLVEDRSIRSLEGRLTALGALLRGKGWEGVRVDPRCGADDLLAWLTHAYGGAEGAYAERGVLAGRLDLDGAGGGAEAGDRWPGGYEDYVPDVNRVLQGLVRGDAEGLQEARGIVRSIFTRIEAGDELLVSVRRLKEFDEYTFTHALNVCIVSLVVARALGAPTDLTQAMGLAGLCHDVGKERVPLEILNKPGALSPEERAVVSRHASEGAEILLRIPGSVPPLLPTVAHQHHMNADRSGYPAGVGEAGPHPASLLVQVADVFDALRTVRPYRGTMDETQAINVMLRDAGDGRLDRAFLGALVKAFRILQPGRRVELDDGRRAVVMGVGDANALEALVEVEDGDIVDLSDPVMPPIAKLEAAEAP